MTEHAEMAADSEMSSEEADDLTNLLPLLKRAEDICFTHVANGVGIICAGLRLLLAEILIAETIPGTEVHDAAARVIKE